MEELQTVLLKGGREILGLLLDQVLVGVEVLGDEGEKAPRGRAGRQVVGLDGELDVQDLSVGAQHVPRHVDFDKHQFLIDHLQEEQMGIVLGRHAVTGNFQRVQSTYRLCCLQLHPHLHQAGLKVLSPCLERSAQEERFSEF